MFVCHYSFFVIHFFGNVRILHLLCHHQGSSFCAVYIQPTSLTYLKCQLNQTKPNLSQAVVTHAFNLSTQEVETGGSEFVASLVYRVNSGQPGIRREILSWKTFYTWVNSHALILFFFFVVVGLGLTLKVFDIQSRVKPTTNSFHGKKFPFDLDLLYTCFGGVNFETMNTLQIGSRKNWPNHLDHVEKELKLETERHTTRHYSINNHMVE